MSGTNLQTETEARAHAHTHTHTCYMFVFVRLCRQTQVFRLLCSTSAKEGHAAGTVRLREKASGAPKCVPSTDMSAVPRVHATANHTVSGRTQHLLQLPARPPVPRRQQVPALRPATARDAQHGAGNYSAWPVLPVSLQRRRLSLEVQCERHQKAPRTMSTSLVRLPAEGAEQV